MIRKTAFESLGLAVLKICINGNVLYTMTRTKFPQCGKNHFCTLFANPCPSLKISRCDLVGSTSLLGRGTSKYIKADENKRGGKAK